jgi:hypothetical protein
LRKETVPDTVYGHEVRWCGRINLELLAESDDMRVDRSSIWVIFIPPHGVQNQISRKHTLRVMKEEEEQIVFCGRDLDFFAPPGHITAFEIYFDVTEVSYAACIVAAAA